MDTIIDGFLVVAGIYVAGALGAYAIKEDARFERTVRVLKCEKCPGIAGRSQDTSTALCVKCDHLTVPTYHLANGKASQKVRAAKRGAVPDDFHELMSPQALYDKWNADKACVHW